MKSVFTLDACMIFVIEILKIRSLFIWFIRTNKTFSGDICTCSSSVLLQPNEINYSCFTTSTFPINIRLCNLLSLCTFPPMTTTRISFISIRTVTTVLEI